MLFLKQLLEFPHHTLKSVICKFFILLSNISYGTFQVNLSNKKSLLSVFDHFLYSHDLNVWFRGDIHGRNLMLIMLRIKSVKVGGHYSLLINSFILMTVCGDIWCCDHSCCLKDFNFPTGIKVTSCLICVDALQKWMRRRKRSYSAQERMTSVSCSPVGKIYHSFGLVLQPTLTMVKTYL